MLGQRVRWTTVILGGNAGAMSCRYATTDTVVRAAIRLSETGVANEDCRAKKRRHRGFGAQVWWQ
jgi:hypothetical protein